MTARSSFIKKAVEKNIVDELADLRRRLAALEVREGKDRGVMEAKDKVVFDPTGGLFAAYDEDGNQITDINPDDFLLPDGTVLAAKMGLATSGDAIYQEYTVNSVTGALQVGVEDNSDASAPVAYMRFTNPGGTNLLTENPGFEDGDLTGWTVTSVTISSHSRDGTYGAYISNSSGGSIETASANRASVTAGIKHDFSVYVSGAFPLQYIKVTAQFYDAGGTAQGTVTMFDGYAGVNWSRKFKSIYVPAGATKAGIKVINKQTTPYSAVFLDSASIAVSASQGEMLLTAGGNFDITGAMTMLSYGNFRFPTIVLDDDTATSFTPVQTTGGISVVMGQTGSGGLAYYRATATPLTAIIVGGANFAVTTGALAGTTGTDTKITISAHTDGKIYVENRTGASRTVIIGLS